MQILQRFSLCMELVHVLEKRIARLKEKEGPKAELTGRMDDLKYELSECRDEQHSLSLQYGQLCSQVINNAQVICMHAACSKDSITRLARTQLKHAFRPADAWKAGLLPFCLLHSLLHPLAIMLGSMQVLVSTLSGAGSWDMFDRTFKLVVMDEASQATEAAMMVPLVGL